MPRRSELRITKRTVDALTVQAEDAVFWDRDLAGFGVRVPCHGPQGLRGPVPGAHRAEASDPRAAWGYVDR